jgi:hypothetical protein
MYSAVPMLTAAGRASHAPLLSLSLLLLLLRMSVELSLLRPQLLRPQRASTTSIWLTLCLLQCGRSLSLSCLVPACPRRT